MYNTQLIESALKHASQAVKVRRLKYKVSSFVLYISLSLLTEETSILTYSDPKIMPFRTMHVGRSQIGKPQSPNGHTIC